MADNENITKDDLTAGELDPDVKILIEQARMAKRRSEVPCPDIDLAWANLDSTLPTNKSQQESGIRHNSWRLWGAAFLGAAAMLAIVFVYTRFFLSEESDSMVALAYDNSPQYITLQGESSTLTNLTHKDSISYYNTAKQTSETAAGDTVGISEKTVASVIQRLATPRGMDFKVILPDGSEVWLNAASVIEFPSAFTDGERRVVLHGEAYFKVARDENNPFIVSSEHMDVRVLGTEFNMSAYNAEQPYVSLVKGAVEVLKPNESALVLSPGEEVRRTQDGQLHVRKIDTYAVTQWKEGYFYFDNQPLIDVLRELGRWYNLGVIFRRPSILNKKIHFSASRHENIEQALNDISQLLNLKISIEDYNIVIQ